MLTGHLLVSFVNSNDASERCIDVLYDQPQFMHFSELQHGWLYTNFWFRMIGFCR